MEYNSGSFGGRINPSVNAKMAACFNLFDLTFLRRGGEAQATEQNARTRHCLYCIFIVQLVVIRVWN